MPPLFLFSKEDVQYLWTVFIYVEYSGEGGKVNLDLSRLFPRESMFLRMLRYASLDLTQDFRAE